jgi:hypothetical protein
MGIVVTVFMLLGLLMASPWGKCSLGTKRQNYHLANTIGTGLLLAGAWNTFWHGLRYLDYFWGLAGLVSGVFMMLVAVGILTKYGSNFLALNTITLSVSRAIKPFSMVWLMGLLLSFLLYGVTLIQLNLGLATMG